MEREPVSTETLAQHIKQPLAAVAVFESDDKIIGESHQLAVAAQARPRLILEPLVQHMVQENVGENWRDDAPNAKGNFRFEREIVQWRDRPLIDLRRKR